MRSTYSVLALTAFLVITAFGAVAEEIAFVNCHGEVYYVDTDDPENPFRIDPDKPTKQYSKQSRITFNVTFQDVEQNTGIGFNDPVQGEAFRNRLGDVFAYLNTILDHTGTIDVLMEVSMNDPTADLLASAGPGFSMQPGISNGFAFERLTTGVDQFPTMPEITSSVNFGQPWFAGTGAPPAEQFDFFTTMVHEIAHGLGVLGLLEPTPMDGVYTMWDVLTERGDGRRLISATAGNPTFAGTGDDLVSDDLFFAGPMATASFGSRPRVFAPNPYQGGSSLSHFDSERTAPGEIIMGPSGGPGPEPRVFAAFELAALQDIGYQIVGQNNTTPLMLSVTPGTLDNVPAGGATRTLQITFTGEGDRSWTVSTDRDDFISFAPASGTGDATVTVTILDNPFSTPDTGRIFVGAAGAFNSPMAITVNQLAGGVGCAAVGATISGIGNAGDLMLFGLMIAILHRAAWRRGNRVAVARRWWGLRQLQPATGATNSSN